MSNLQKMSDQPVWKLELVVPKAMVEALEDGLMTLAGETPPVISVFEVDDAGLEWTLEALFHTRPAKVAINRLLSTLSSTFDLSEMPYHLVLVPQKDWVRESQMYLKPVSIGRFFIHGSHDRDKIPPDCPDCIALEVEAGQAFGSGSHETTRGCLRALDELADQITPGRVLDLGCGSGILGIAAARIWTSECGCLVVGSDIDDIATATALENARINHVPVVAPVDGNTGFSGITGNGLADETLAGLAPFDLILANILMEPLIQLAPDIARAVRPGGIVMLSGLLDSQEQRVLDVYRNLGLDMQKRVPLNNWHTLILHK